MIQRGLVMLLALGVLVQSSVFATSSVVEIAPSGSRDDMIWNQWDGVGGGYLAYSSTSDEKVADNFQVDTPGYELTEWETYLCYLYGSPNYLKGAWVIIYGDGGTEPATTEPYEYGSNPGWHDDVEGGNGGLGYVTGTVAVDYWDYNDLTETIDWYLWGYYPVYLLSARIEDAVTEGWTWVIPDEVFWFACQRYFTGSVFGPPDCADNLSPDWMIGGGPWTDAGPGGLPLRLYGVPCDDDEDPYITDTYPHDEDYPSGVPVDTWIGCHMGDADSGIRMDASTFDFYDENMDPVNGMLHVDDSDPTDIIIDFEPDEDLNEGETYTVEIYCEDMVGNSASEYWQFTTGYVNITPESLGGIKARYAE
ncbi:MAG: hypothetical protein JSW52_07675 [Candidatus Coatesbacteria bacterium]|nr:MAG: hypothetical protein JSW52_07675 [Candidatus Coatesbacteria bacterium]